MVERTGRRWRETFGPARFREESLSGCEGCSREYRPFPRSLVLHSRSVQAMYDIVLYVRRVLHSIQGFAQK